MARTVKLDNEKHTDLLNIQVELKRLTNVKYSLDLILSNIIDIFKENFSVLELAKRLEPMFQKIIKVPQDLTVLKNLEMNLTKEINKKLGDIKSKLNLYKNIIIKYDQVSSERIINFILADMNIITSKLGVRIGTSISRKGVKDISIKDQIQILKQGYIINYFILKDLENINSEIADIDNYLVNQNFILLNENLVNIKRMTDQIKNTSELKEKLRNNILCFDNIENEVDIAIGDIIRGIYINKEKIQEKLIGIILKIIENRKKENNYNPVLLSTLLTEIKIYDPTLNFKFDDLDLALRKMITQGLIEDYRTFNDIKLIRLVPYNLSQDQIKVIKIASNNNTIRLAQIMNITKWDKERALSVLTSLVNAGLLKYINSYAEGQKWFLII
ncbi:MAG: hypothetical protein ACTSPY_10265 [Candidatus Helarchaeota archaeon]